MLPTYISDVPEVAQRRRHDDHVHGGDERSAPRPAEVLVAVHHHVWVLVSSFVLSIAIHFNSRLGDPFPLHRVLRPYTSAYHTKRAQGSYAGAEGACDVLFHFMMAGSLWRAVSFR